MRVAASAAQSAVRDRNADGRRRRNTGRDAADDFDIDARRMQCLLLFAASAEHEGIAAFETRDAAPFVQMREHLFDDAVLRRRRMTAALADIHDARIGARKLQHVGVHQIVDEYHVGLRERAGCLQRHQFDVAGACADQPCAFHRGMRRVGAHAIAQRRHTRNVMEIEVIRNCAFAHDSKRGLQTASLSRA
jgi:hypothetical protein